MSTYRMQWAKLNHCFFPDFDDWDSFLTEFNKRIKDFNWMKGDVEFTEDMKCTIFLGSLGSCFESWFEFA